MRKRFGPFTFYWGYGDHENPNPSLYWGVMVTAYGFSMSAIRIKLDPAGEVK